MTTQELMKEYKRTHCNKCANKDANVCRITINIDNKANCVYFVNKRIQKCMQTQCSSCKKAYSCFKKE